MHLSRWFVPRLGPRRALTLRFARSKLESNHAALDAGLPPAF